MTEITVRREDRGSSAGRGESVTLESVNGFLRELSVRKKAVKLVFIVRLAFESKLANGSEGLRA